MFDVKILPSGDSAVLIQLGSVISPQVNAAVHALDAGIKSANIMGLSKRFQLSLRFLFSTIPL